MAVSYEPSVLERAGGRRFSVLGEAGATFVAEGILLFHGVGAGSPSTAFCREDLPVSGLRDREVAATARPVSFPVILPGEAKPQAKVMVSRERTQGTQRMRNRAMSSLLCVLRDRGLLEEGGVGLRA